MLPQSKIIVLSAHSEPLIDLGLVTTLARSSGVELISMGETAPSDAALLDFIASCRPDVVITDYERAGWLSEQQAQLAGHRKSRPRIVVISNRGSQAEVRKAMKQGVSGYLVGSASCDEVLESVKRVFMGMRHVSDALARCLLQDVLEEQLTRRECDVLQLAALGCSNKTIATRLEVELGTVKSHMTAILDKLGAKNRTEAVLIANERGLLAPSVTTASLHAVVSDIQQQTGTTGAGHESGDVGASRSAPQLRVVTHRQSRSSQRQQVRSQG